MPYYGLAYKEAFKLQRIMLQLASSDDVKPADRATCARVWETLEDRKRIIRGVLKPGSVNESRKGSAQPDKRRRRSDDDVKPVGHAMSKPSVAVEPEPVGPVEPKRDESAKSATVEQRTDPKHSDPAPEPIAQDKPRTAQPDPGPCPTE